MRANGLSMMLEDLEVDPDPPGMANLLCLSARRRARSFRDPQSLSRKVMALTARVAALDRRDAGDDVADLAAPSKSLPPTSANMTDVPSILAGSAMSPNSFEVSLVRLGQDFCGVIELICKRAATKPVNLASPSRYCAMNAFVRKSSPSGIDHEVLDRIVDPILRRRSMARPHSSAASPFKAISVASASAKADTAFLKLLARASDVKDRRIVLALPEEQIRPGAVAAVAGCDGLATRRAARPKATPKRAEGGGHVVQEDVDEFAWVARFGEGDEGHARNVVGLKQFGPAVDLLVQVGFGVAFNKALFS